MNPIGINIILLENALVIINITNKAGSRNLPRQNNHMTDIKISQGDVITANKATQKIINRLKIPLFFDI